MINVYKQGKRGRESFLPFFLPAGKSGNVEIQHKIAKKGDKLTVVSMRNAIFMGLRPTSLLLPCDVLVHWLIENDKNGNKIATWMSTMPQEIEQHERQLARAHGDVLVGGLGLGLACALLSKNRRVRSITCVEKNADIIKLVRPYLARPNRPKGIFVMHADLFEFLKKMKRDGRRFDFAFYDIWCPTGERVLTEFVLPLRKASIGVVEQYNIECWNELEMIGQVKMGIASRLMFEFNNDDRRTDLKVSTASDVRFNDMRKAMRETWPFWNWLRKKRPSEAAAKIVSESYIAHLQDAVAFKRFWARFDKIS